MEGAQTNSQVINAESSLATTLARLANVRVQVELIQEDTNSLNASYQEEREIILKRRTKA